MFIRLSHRNDSHADKACVLRGKVTSQEGLQVHLQGGAGHGELKALDDVGVEDPQPAHADPAHKHLGAAAREEGGV